MLNYVMLYFLAYLLSSHSLMEAPGGSNAITLPITSNAHLPLLAGTHLRINAGFLIALAAALAVWWLLNRTTTGFEFRSIGANASASRVAGMNVERNWALVMTIAGGLAGLAAATVILGTDFTLNPQSYGTYGIDAITVALLGLGRPGGVVAAGLLFGALHAGSPGMQIVDRHAGADRAGHTGADRAVRGGAAADPGHVPAARGHGQAESAPRCPRGGTRDDACLGRAPAGPARTRPAGRRRRRAVRRPVRGADHVRGLRAGQHPRFRAARARDATFSFTPEFAKVTVPNLTLAAAATCYVCGAITLALAVVRPLDVLGLIHLGRVWRRVIIGVVLFLFIIALLAWADGGQSIPFNVVNLLSGTLNGSIPIMLGALTGVICSRQASSTSRSRASCCSARSARRSRRR